MTLLELSKQYRQEEAAIYRRLQTLRLQRRRTKDRSEAEQLRRRIRTLQTLLLQARQLAELTEHYYDRGYKRNEFYTL